MSNGDINLKVVVDSSDVPPFVAAFRKATDAVAELGVETEQVGAANVQAAAGVEEHSSKQQRLSELLGTSRAQTGFLVREIAQMSGVTGDASTALNALTSGIGPAGIAMTGLALAFKVAHEEGEKVHKANSDLALSMARVGASTEGITVALKAQNAEMDSHFNRTVAMEGQYRKMAEAMVAAFPPEYVRLLHASTQGIVDHTGATIAAAGSMAEYSAAVLKGAEALAPLNFAGKEWKDLTNEQKAAMIALAEALGTYSAYTTDAANRTVTFVEQTERAVGAADSLAVALGRNSAALKDTAGAFVEETQAQGDNVARQVELQAMMQQTTKETQAASAARSVAASAATSAANAAIRDAQREAQAESDLHKMVAEASRGASAEVAANFAVIEHSALSAAEKTRLLHQYIASLPADVQAQINLWINTHGIAQLMALFGGQLGMRKSTGHQQGDEWNFTLSGEDQATRQDYERRYGQTQEANDAWQRDHRAELERKGVTGPGQPNTETGQIYDYGKANSGNQGIETAVAILRTELPVPSGQPPLAGLPVIIPAAREQNTGQTVNNFSVSIYALVNDANAEILRAHALPELARMLHDLGIK